jgi:hypothetical protein
MFNTRSRSAAITWRPRLLLRSAPARQARRNAAARYGERESDLIDEIAARLDFARGVYYIDCGHNHRPELP